MGSRIVAFYAEAETIAGLDGKIQLAMLTRIPSTRALLEPDSPQTIARFENAIQTIRKSIPPSIPVRNGFAHSTSAPRFSLEFSGTQRALPQGEELLWGVLNSLTDAMVAVYERTGQSLLAWESKPLERKYPLAGNDALGTVIARFVGTQLQSAIADVFDGADARQEEICCSAGPHLIWLHVVLSSIHDEKGKILGVNAFIQDITQRKEHEEQLVRSEARLREHNRVFVELLSQKSSFIGDVAATLRRITEAAAHTLSVARVSVWLYNADRTAIECANLYQVSSAEHSSGLTLQEADFPTYFKALREQGTIAAMDAHTDPRTSCFSAGYLTPLGIHAMLDVPIWAHGEMIGVVCHEHMGAPRQWTTDEENFAYLMANFVALAKETALQTARADL